MNDIKTKTLQLQTITAAFNGKQYQWEKQKSTRNAKKWDSMKIPSKKTNQTKK